MTPITWDAVTDRRYETGIDRGVLYLTDGSGVAWNGLTGVDETFDMTTDPYFVDGLKYMDNDIPGDFAATLRAFTYPDEFEQFNGIKYYDYGLSVDDQPIKPFGLSYRTKVGDGLDPDRGYLIHILYNLVAIQSSTTFASMSNPVTPVEFSWSLTATPEAYDTFRPTAHIVIDSTEISPFLLETIEGMLYGTSEVEPALPDFTEFLDFITEWDVIEIVDHGDGSWSATGPDELITIGDGEFTITEIDATYLDADTYTIESTEP